MDIDTLLNKHYAGRVVRKDLTKKVKEGYNVPVYVLEYLLGMYCASDDEEAIREGLEQVKGILANNYVRPDESEKIKSKIKELGSYTIIDKVTVKLNENRDRYEAEFSNLGIKGIEMEGNYIKKFDKLLAGGIWCILNMGYFYDELKNSGSPFTINDLKPIQMPNMDMNEIFEGRKHFTKDEWIDVLLRSSGLEPEHFTQKVKWHFLTRLIPLVENNYNMCELGPRGTGKSHIYKEISPYSVLVSGGQTTVANLFYNMSRNVIGLVGLWDVVAFDEVAGIKFKDKDGIQIMKDFMASGSFVRGRDQKNANASMVFIGNINQSVDFLIKTSHLFIPFPEEMNSDTAFFDRMHYYLPGWEIPKMRPEYFTDRFGFIVDYLAEYLREMRKTSFTDVLDRYFRIGNNLNQRDVIAIRKTVSGLVKLLYPDGNFSREDIKEILEYALTGRRRVKEQLKKIGGMEFYDVHFSYIDNETMEENFVSVPEHGTGKLIPEGPGKPGHVYTVARGDTMIGVYKIELQIVSGTGKLQRSGFGANSSAKESVNVAFNYFKATSKQISSSINTKIKDYHLHVQDLQGVGLPEDLTLLAFVSLCSGAMDRAVQEQMVILGGMSIGGTITKVPELANSLQVCFDAGAKKVLLPLSSAVDIATVPPELFAKFQTSFYNDPVDAAYKALGVG